MTTATAGGYTIQQGVNVFPPGLGSNSIFSIAKNFVPSHNLNFNLQIEQSLSNKVVGAIRIRGISGAPPAFDPRYQPGAARSLRHLGRAKRDSPLSTAPFPAYTFINEIQSIGNSNYNSLQATLACFRYTWVYRAGCLHLVAQPLTKSPLIAAPCRKTARTSGATMGRATSTRATFSSACSLTTFLEAEKWHLLTKGWQLNSLLTFHSGNPFSVFSSADTSGTDEGVQRANVVPGVSPYAGFKQAKVNANWLNPAAFADAAAGTFGNTGRNAYVGPGFGDVDFSVFKNTPLSGNG